MAARQTRVDDPVDAALKAPHPAILVGWGLALVAVATILALAQGLQAPTASAIVTTALLALATTAGAIALTAYPQTRTMVATLAGLALLDVAPPLLQLTAASPYESRARVALLAIPTVIAASSLAGRYFRSQLLAALGLAVIMLAFVTDDAVGIGRSIELVVVVGTLAAGGLMVLRVSRETAQHVDDLRALALTDTLTGALNRRGLADGFPNLRSRRKPSTVGILSLDIDHFKWFNDTYGHPAGDEVLRLVTRVLSEVAGPEALVARTGGEELVAVVTGPAEPIADRFRSELAKSSEPRVTVSIGIVDAEINDYDGPDTIWQLLDAADRAMYTAKTTGRDRICRGTVDRARVVRPPLAPAPKQAAVEQSQTERDTPWKSLPGWVLAAISLIGLFSTLQRHEGVGNAPGQLILFLDGVCLFTGIVVIAMGPLMDRFRWATGVIGTDLVLLTVILDVPDSATRMMVLIPLLITGLMVAQQFGRRTLIAHHAIVLALSMAAPLAAPSATAGSLALLAAAIVIGATELIYFLQQRNLAAAADLHRWSVTDPLTGLANRHGLELGFENLSRAQQLTVLALDVDDFKSINDTFGHAAGDDALIRLAQLLQSVSITGTVVCRTGGDEFIVLAPNERPSALTSKVKRAAALLPLPLSVSTGSAVAAPHRLRSLWQLVDAADAALIRAKRSRRQQRVVTRPDGAADWSEDAAADERGTADLAEVPARPGVISGPDAAERAELDAREFGHPAATAAHAESRAEPGAESAAAAYPAATEPSRSAEIDSSDGSASETSTRTISPSEIDPARSSRAS